MYYKSNTGSVHKDLGENGSMSIFVGENWAQISKYEYAKYDDTALKLEPCTQEEFLKVFNQAVQLIKNNI